MMLTGGSEKDKYMKTQVQVAFDKKNESLIVAGWIYVGSEFWIDPVSKTKLMTKTARQVQKARQAFAERQKQPKLLLCSDWEGIRNELNRQLKPLGLHVTTKGNYKKWGDQLQWTVSKLPDPARERYERRLAKLGIDPWNCFA
jgi:hypothetical protein